MKAAFVTYSRQQAQTPQVIVDKAPRAETNGQIYARQYKDNQIERPTNNSGFRQKEYKGKGYKKCCSSPLRETMGAGSSSTIRGYNGCNGSIMSR
jgi:hypothetical protein